MTDQEISIDINTNVKTGGKVVFVSGLILAEELDKYIDDHIDQLQEALNSMKKTRGLNVDSL